MYLNINVVSIPIDLLQRTQVGTASGVNFSLEFSEKNFLLSLKIFLQRIGKVFKKKKTAAAAKSLENKIRLDVEQS